MNRSLGKKAGVLAVTTLLIAWGCGGPGGPPPITGSTEEFEVKGTATLQGKPAGPGKLTFNPANIIRRNVLARTAEVAKDGTFTVKTMEGPNLVTAVGIKGAPRNTLVIDVMPGQELPVELAPVPDYLKK